MKQYKEMVADLAKECLVFLQQVETIGNECAFTDRQLETIIDKAQELVTTYVQDGVC